jgi:hypothetical protein
LLKSDDGLTLYGQWEAIDDAYYRVQIENKEYKIALIESADDLDLDIRYMSGSTYLSN